jgi:hypothetical protein
MRSPATSLSEALFQAVKSCVRSSVPIMRLHRCRRHIQLLDMLCPNVNDFVEVLENAFDHQELGIGHQRPVSFIKIGIDGVRDFGCVFNRQKDEPVLWPMPHEA